MIRQIQVQNFKSILNMKLELGRFNVFIGENGCGKSNILEALTLAAATAAGKADPEFLYSRGVRVTEPEWFRPAFEGEFGESRVVWDGEPIPLFKAPQPRLSKQDLEALTEGARSQISQLEQAQRNKVAEVLRSEAERYYRLIKNPFLLYTPEYTTLRSLKEEGQIRPLGVRGEGLYEHLYRLSQQHPERYQAVLTALQVLDWFTGMELSSQQAPFARGLSIQDRHLLGGRVFDQRSANEGFLFLLFYFTLFCSPETPSFFAIDNVDTGLNPRLCAKLVTDLAELAARFDKQALLTTHNPALLDGLNLHDEEQRLFVVSRDSEGHTRARRVLPPKPLGDEPPVRLSEAFLRGILGGLPTGF